MNSSELLDYVLGQKNERDFKDVISEFPGDIPVFIFDDKRSIVVQEGSIYARISATPHEQFKMYLNEYSLGDSDRGIILSHFSLIEFLLQVIILIGEGTYDNPSNYEEVKEFWFNDESMTTAKRIKYARYKKLIRKKTKENLWLAKDIRNKLAHQYLPELELHSTLATQLQSQARSKDKPSLSKAIEKSMTTAWDDLLEDFTQIQQPIVNYLEKSMVTSGKLKVIK